MPVFSKLLPVAGAAYGLQAILGGIAVPMQTDIFFDIGGALGWLSTTFVSIYYPHIKALLWDKAPTSFPSPLDILSPRQLLLSAAVSLWAVRIGTYLGVRNIKNGGDARFAEIKKQPRRFSGFWFGQGTWIMLVGLPIWLANTIPPSLEPELGPRDYLGAGLWATGFLMEVVADWQKSSWQAAKKRKLHDEKFITSGLWSISRHPNYVGEVGLWTGAWLLASGAFQTPLSPMGTTALAAASPLMTWFLLTKVSGIPPMERLGDKRYGNDPKWHEYKTNVPLFLPKLW